VISTRRARPGEPRPRDTTSTERGQVRTTPRTMRGRGQGLAARSVASRGGSGGRASARIIHSQSVLRRGHRRALNMIIVSESSAKVTQLVRTTRYTPARSRSSAALNDIPRYAEVQAISVHT
jgi:hypothetical protein